MKKIIKFFQNHLLVSVIIVALVFGLAGGIAGTLIARSYLIDSSYNFSSGKYTDQGIVISNPKNVIVQQDVKIDETIKAVSGSLVGIYKKQQPAKSGEAFVLENFYKLSEPSGQGFIISSDGWIITGLELEKVYADYVVITADKKIYAITRAQSDNLTGFNFIQVAAKDLPVRKFAENQEVKRGSSAVNVNWLGASWISSVRGFSGKSGLVKSSDSASKKLVLNEKLPAEFSSAMVFNLAGDALGLVDSSGEVEPMSRFKGVIKNLFQGKIAQRASLGVNYLDLSQLVAVSEQNNLGQKGALVYQDQKGVAVLKSSPAEASGLRQGDIIISVDNTEINQDNDLADIIQGYAPGDKIILTFLRAGEEKDAEIVLGEQK